MQKKFVHSIDQFLKLSQQEIIHEFNELNKEFEETQQYKSQLFACTEQQQKQNRYHDVLPYKNNIVKPEGVEYFNASPIALLSGKKLIATQAPLTPFEYFWKMVMNQNIGLIVMLCPLNDPNRGKQADQYWPNQGTLIEGSLNITIQSNSKLGKQFDERKLLVKNQTCQKIIKQIHWQGWNDMGVPSQQSLSIIQKIISQISSSFSSSNILIHCSAGVGRTGTLISVLDGVLLLNKGVNNISIYEIVSNIRKQRFGSVEKPVQYQFIFEYLRGHIINKNKNSDL